MPESRLRALLRELHQELEESPTGTSDPEARRLLREVMDDIHDALERPEARNAGSLAERANGMLVDLETSHPQVGFALKRLAKALGDMGI